MAVTTQDSLADSLRHAAGVRWRADLRPGAEKLLRALVLDGLPAESLRAAAALVAELDRQPEAGLEPQTDGQRLESRARIFIGRDGFGKSPPRGSIGPR